MIEREILQAFELAVLLPSLMFLKFKSRFGKFVFIRKRKSLQKRIEDPLLFKVLLEKYEEDTRSLQEHLRGMSTAMVRNDQFRALAEGITGLFQAFAGAVLNNQEDSD